MTTLISTDSRDPWIRRLLLPAYQVKDAASATDSASSITSAICFCGSKKAIRLIEIPPVTNVGELNKADVAVRVLIFALDPIPVVEYAEFPDEFCNCFFGGNHSACQSLGLARIFGK